MTTAHELAPLKAHPRLFSGPMVLAILEDRKSQTRRLIARANSLVDGSPCPKALWERLDFSKAWADPGPSPAGNPGPYLKVPTKDGETTYRIYSRVWPPDRIWVKETHLRGTTPGTVWYRATEPERIHSAVRWTPSIHMPRWASRITLDVIAVRPESLIAISEDDARAEGVTPISGSSHRDAFKKLWDELNGKDDPWCSAPWVWVYGFSRVKP